jgi:hypothetical protein
MHDDMRTIERERFEAWLDRQPADRVWRYDDMRNCVVACFVRETTGETHPIVSSVSVWLDSFSRVVEIPAWLRWVLRRSIWEERILAADLKLQLEEQIRIEALMGEVR